MSDSSTMDLREDDVLAGAGSDGAVSDAVEVPEPRRPSSTSGAGPGPTHPGPTQPGPTHPGPPHPGPPHPGPTQPGPTQPGRSRSGQSPSGPAATSGPVARPVPGMPAPHPGPPHPFGHRAVPPRTAFGPWTPTGPAGPWAPGPAGIPPHHLPPFGHAPVPPPRPRRRVWPAVLLALACLAGGSAAGAVAGNAAAPASAGGDSVSAAAAIALPSTVTIVGNDGSSGSGVVLTADGQNGTILTNAHVVQGPTEMRAIFADGSVAPLQVAGTAPRADVALLRVSGATDLHPARLGDSRTLRPGDTVLALGEPLGLSQSVTRGIVSATGRAFPGDREPDVLDTIQTDAAINHGNSGGPLVDVDGRVVGISSRSIGADPREGAESLGFAIPIEHANRIAGELAASGRATLAALPVTLEDIGAPGARVTAVTAGSGAEAAGLRTGDVITRFDGEPVTAAVDLQAAVQSSVPGTAVRMDVTGADGTSRPVSVVLDTTDA